MLKVCALYSGSSGNSILVGNQDDKREFHTQKSGSGFFSSSKILVDVGVNGKALQLAMQSIDETISDIKGIILTHEHIDHMRGVGVIMRRFGIPLYINELTWNKMQTLDLGKIPSHLVKFIKCGQPFEIGDLLIESFSTPHDAVDSMGYRIYSGNKSVSIFTDIGKINDSIIRSVEGSDSIFIESNYDYEMLMNGVYPWPLKKRIHGELGHLSNSDCAFAVAALLKKGTTHFILSHLSKENNSPLIALNTTRNHLEEMGAKIDKDVIVSVARRNSPSEPFVIK